MKYPEGDTIQTGDLVWWNEGTCVGRVSLILENQNQWLEWGLDEPGAFVCCDFSGKTLTQDVFNAESYFQEDGFGKVSPDEEAEIKNFYAKFCSLHPGSDHLPVRHRSPWKRA